MLEDKGGPYRTVDRYKCNQKKNALTRFTSQRGCPGWILTDNSTAFVGAERLLMEGFEEAFKKQKDLAKFCTVQKKKDFLPCYGAS
jgi:hypothetical protein